MMQTAPLLRKPVNAQAPIASTNRYHAITFGDTGIVKLSALFATIAGALDLKQP
jgi:hypothetical protein